MSRELVWAAVVLALVGCGSSQDDPKLPDDGAAGTGVQAQVTPPAGVATPDMTTTTPADTSSTPASNVQNPQGAQQGTSKPDTMQQGQAAPMQQETTPEVQGIAPPEGFKANAMDECGLHTKWPGDEYCILPPPPDKGFQLHIGPSNYDNPEATYVLQPGQENVHTYTTTSANDKDIQFYVRQYRMRPGAHHTIVRDTSTGRRLSGSDVNQDHPVGGIIAPENAGIGVPLAAHAPISVDHHAINTGDEPLLQEVWVNFWYVDPAKVTETTTLLYDPGTLTDTVAPGADVVLGPYACDIEDKGRLISMFGHVHANNVRFSAWRTRGTQKDLIYESYHWEDPLWLEFTSLAKNPAADPSKLIDGGWTGILDLEPGDTLSWECHEVNTQNVTLTFTNQTYTGQMCIIIGDLVGTKCKSRNPMAALFDPSRE
jgi:hypothetical protein